MYIIINDNYASCSLEGSSTLRSPNNCFKFTTFRLKHSYLSIYIFVVVGIYIFIIDTKRDFSFCNVHNFFYSSGAQINESSLADFES